MEEVLDSLPPARRRLAAGALLLALVLLLGGRHLLHSGTAANETSAAAPAVPIRAEEGPKLVVHVVGAVHRPGLYRLAHGSRVADAVTRAGGPARRADLSLVNLAAPLADGLQVVVPLKPAAGAPSGAGAAAEGPVHLNVATLEQLDSLPGVGPVTAQKILDHREKHGAFTSLDELDAIPGIGAARIEQLRDVAAP